MAPGSMEGRVLPAGYAPSPPARERKTTLGTTPVKNDVDLQG